MTPKKTEQTNKVSAHEGHDRGGHQQLLYLELSLPIHASFGWKIMRYGKGTGIVAANINSDSCVLRLTCAGFRVSTVMWVDEYSTIRPDTLHSQDQHSWGARGDSEESCSASPPAAGNEEQQSTSEPPQQHQQQQLATTIVTKVKLGISCTSTTDQSA